MVSAKRIRWGMPDCELHGKCAKVERCPYLSSISYMTQESGIYFNNLNVTRGSGKPSGPCVFEMSSAEGFPDGLWKEVADDLSLVPVPSFDMPERKTGIKESYRFIGKR